MHFVGMYTTGKKTFVIVHLDIISVFCLRLKNQNERYLRQKLRMLDEYRRVKLERAIDQAERDDAPAGTKEQRRRELEEADREMLYRLAETANPDYIRLRLKLQEEFRKRQMREREERERLERERLEQERLEQERANATSSTEDPALIEGIVARELNSSTSTTTTTTTISTTTPALSTISTIFRVDVDAERSTTSTTTTTTTTTTTQVLADEDENRSKPKIAVEDLLPETAIFLGSDIDGGLTLEDMDILEEILEEMLVQEIAKEEEEDEKKKKEEDNYEEYDAGDEFGDYYGDQDLILDDEEEEDSFLSNLYKDVMLEDDDDKETSTTAAEGSSGNEVLSATGSDREESILTAPTGDRLNFDPFSIPEETELAQQQRKVRDPGFRCAS